MAKVISREALALEGGPKAVTAPANDTWERVSPLEKQYVNAVLDDYGSAYDEIEKFEEQFRDFVGTRYALAHCNGTSTIHAAVFASGARLGKEVIVPSVTWHASITPILHCNATPVFCDIDPETFCADPEDVRRKITPNTCAIIVTHVYGNPADMDAFREMVEGTDITLIEDASHAHGATWDGLSVGSLGDIGCFSLQGSKAVTGIEAGVATTNCPDLYDRMLALGHYGRNERMWQTEQFRSLHNIGLGVKYRANPLAMAMARAQLERLPELNEKRLAWFRKLDDLLEPIPGIHPQKTYPSAVRGGLLLYAGVFDPAEIGAPVNSVLKALVAEGVSTKPAITPFGYGVMHLEPLFTDFSFEGLGGPWGDLPSDTRQPLKRGSLPVSERVHDSCFWLSTPVDPSEDWLEQTAAAVRKVVEHGPRLVELLAKAG